ncbi:hypothetical protein FHX68_0846 [Microbacterium lacticum]|uniref:Uncharacterized protein n=1 Tax=Microbacterium lacticum TaxID=33885 RepID=A0A4Y3UGE1_9MICO|nr:hypothetical protein FHX68_0846 [Microbacterium lacticum]GEB93991.1 hypothetical protein MLA01_02100 [Microbacterium lacticum]GGN13924.1 hypothetical protein GCM10009724_04220 [Microbacterium lacticum]
MTIACGLGYGRRGRMLQGKRIGSNGAGSQRQGGADIVKDAPEGVTRVTQCPDALETLAKAG